MPTFRRLVVGVIVLLTAHTVANAQAQITATTVADAPVFGSPDANQSPLRVARAGSVLILLDQTADWCRVEFQDPEFGRRVGYIQTRLVRIAAPAGRGVAANQGSRTPAASAREQRGDVAFGYVFGYDGDELFPVTYPIGIAGSDAWRLAPNVDFVLEGQFAHGTLDLISAEIGSNVFTVQGGVRFWGGSRYGQSVRAFGQVLSGWLLQKATLGSLAIDDVNGLNIQPGFGVEVPVAGTFAIRPQFDVLIFRANEAWDNAFRVNVNAVFRLYH